MFRTLCPDGPVWPQGKRSAFMLTFDADADSSWLSRGLDEPIARSSGAFEITVGLPNILELMRWFGLKTTFFVPGWIAQQYPNSVLAIADAGHEVGLHNFLHEAPPGLSEAQERDIIERGCTVIERLIGVRPTAYRSPFWQLSANTVRLLHEAGFSYISDYMHHLLPSYLQLGPTTIDVVNLPVSWMLDDAVFFQFHPTIRTTLRAPAEVLDIWKDEFHAIHASGGCFILTAHPQLSGRPSRVLMLKQLLDYVRGFDDVWLASPAEMVRHWRAAHPLPQA